jgi:hypothetical protein
VVYNSTLTWANPSLVTLERQMEVPLFGTIPVESLRAHGRREGHGRLQGPVAAQRRRHRAFLRTLTDERVLTDKRFSDPFG